MSIEAEQPSAGRIAFTGSRWELAGVVLRSYLLMIPTLGLYRFWQLTAKRRFYWANTIIAGEPLEYTGTAVQLLLGFLFALAFFLPIYIGLFVLATQPSEIVLIGYGAIAVMVWFLSGYALYRGRDFRLSRTLWRGIRFDQKGNAWAYALWRLLWSILMALTLGLAYPFMAASLWRYRYRHTWYGDRNFAIAGGARQLFAPFYGAYALNAVVIASVVVYVVVEKDYIPVGAGYAPGPFATLLIAAAVVLLFASIAYFRCREHVRMLSSVTIGEAALSVRLSARRLFAQYVVAVLASVAALALLSLIGLVAFGMIYASARGGAASDPAAFAQIFSNGTVNVLMLIAAYLAVLALLALISDIVLGFGWWVMLARGTTIINAETLTGVRSVIEDRALIGEGLADALNVGAY